MIKYIATWAHALYLSDILRHNKIDFTQYVTSGATVEFIFDDIDAGKAERLCKGLARKKSVAK